MTLELFGASTAAVTEPTDVSGPFPIAVQATDEAVPSRVRTTVWHAATRCFGESGFMLKVGKKLQAPSLSKYRDGRIEISGRGVVPGVAFVPLKKPCCRGSVAYIVR